MNTSSVVSPAGGNQVHFTRRKPGTGRRQTVTVRVGHLTLPTYLPAPPDRNPMFLERRVYQGSSGRVYPLPVTDRISERPVPRPWRAVWIENEFLRALVLPELGGRVHLLQDKTNGYHLIYAQPVIKPALVGLAGPWISGGIEFNWPQHHRPATFLPVDVEIESHPDGSKTVWCSDHEPLTRMKGMHGVCLHPARSFLELKVRACNRTPLVQTFLWWANVATRVHESYQSFFPSDVFYVADHARRATSAYPLAQGVYYGVNYGRRARAGVPPRERPSQFQPPHCGGQAAVEYPPNDLSFYANIPTPCSYMCMGSRQDFFGGYDHAAQAGIVHVANHHISPGKKQWTWGNHDFGYAWDRNLTEKDITGRYPPYIEIMAGVYTDNQPDFSFLQPGETKTWSQFWYPIQHIGPAQQANLDAAVSCRLADGGAIARLGVCVTRSFPKARVILTAFPGPRRADAPPLDETQPARRVGVWTRDLAPGRPFVQRVKLPPMKGAVQLTLRVADQHGREIISCTPQRPQDGTVPPPATEPPAPPEVPSIDELFLTGLHLDQYRHATRCPTLYWREALRRDPLDARCNHALGLWHLKRGEFAQAEACFRKAIQRLTHRNANPYDGEPYYSLGLSIRYQLDMALNPQPAVAAARFEEAYAAFYKATWNQAWAGPGYHALAEMDCRRGHWETALAHLDRCLRLNADNTRARNLQAVVLLKLGRHAEASRCLAGTLALDRLDWWARHLSGQPLQCDLQVALDLALDYARAGLYLDGIGLLETVRLRAKTAGRAAARAASQAGLTLPDQNWGAAPMVYYCLGWLETKAGNARAARRHYATAAALPPHYCFPSRLEEIGILQAAAAANPRDPRAPACLGHLLYDRRRHEEAIRAWERSVSLDPTSSVVWRNLGIGYFNIRRNPAKARAAYDRAVQANPRDARLLYERDQLWKRLGVSPAKRLRELQRHPALVRQRDDLSLEWCALLNQVGRHQDALDLLNHRHFQPWEGGEGGPLGQHTRTHLALGRQALAAGRADAARAHFAAALTAPENLGEARHLLANQSDIHYWLGCAHEALGNPAAARRHWQEAASFKGDFQEMSVRVFSEMTYFSALAAGKLGRSAACHKLLRELLGYSRSLAHRPARIDYFATSLPTLLLFDDDLQFRQETTALLLQAQARLGLGQTARARALLRQVLRRDPNHPLAADLLRDL